MLKIGHNVELVSLIFIPHGIKVGLVLIFGLRVFPAIFFAQFLNGLIMENFLNLNVHLFNGALGGTLCLALPLILHNLSSHQAIFSAPLFQSNKKKSYFWMFLSFSVVASLLNSLFHSAINGFEQEMLPWAYQFGDIFGSIIIFFASILILRPFVLSSFAKKNFHDKY